MKRHLLKNILAPIVALFVAFVALPQAAQAQTTEAYVVEDGATLTFYYDTNKATRTGTVYGINDKLTGSKTVPAWAGQGNNINTRITKVVFDNSFKDYKPTDTSYWFYYCRTLETIEGIKNLSTNKVTTMKSMFESCYALKSLDLTNFDTSKVTDMRSMFYECKSLTALDLSSFNTVNVTEMSYMFKSCSSLSSLDISSFNTSNVTDMGSMFDSCSSLSSLDLSSFDTSKVTEMLCMFDSCSSLSSLDLSSFNTSNVTRMYEMFYGCSKLSSLDLSNFDTSNVTNMAGMFRECSSLSSLDLSNFNTSNVTDMYSMFGSCSSLSSLDLSSFDTSKVNDMVYMFYKCSKLTTIYCNDDWNSNVVSTSHDMFDGCKSIVGAVAYVPGKDDVTMANPTTGYFTKVSEAYVVEDGATLTFYYDTNKATRTGTVYGINDKQTGSKIIPAWAGGDKNINTRITKVVFDNSFKNYKPTSTDYWFYNCRTLETIEGIENFSTDQVTTMLSMFENCYALKSLDLTSFDTSNVTNMNFMFCFCSSLSSLDLTNFDTSKVDDMDYLFYNCSNLTTIYCDDDWNTTTVAFSDYMFYGCTSLVGAVAFDSSKTDVTMANPTTGYFTKRDGGIESLESEAVPAARRGIYNLQGIKMQGSFDQLPAGFYIVNGQKVFKK